MDLMERLGIEQELVVSCIRFTTGSAADQFECDRLSNRLALVCRCFHETLTLTKSVTKYMLPFRRATITPAGLQLVLPSYVSCLKLRGRFTEADLCLIIDRYASSLEDLDLSWLGHEDEDVSPHQSTYKQPKVESCKKRRRSDDAGEDLSSPNDTSTSVSLTNSSSCPFGSAQQCYTLASLRLTKLQHITFPDNFNEPEDHLPHYLKEITFGRDFNKPVNQLPPSLKKLSFGRDFDEAVNQLPPGLEELTFGHYFMQPVNQLPPGLEKLTLGYCFNRPVKQLPPGLKELTFGFWFNKEVKQWPANLTRLTFGHKYNQPPIDLPLQLTYVCFGDCFTQSLKEFCERQRLLKTLVLGDGTYGDLPKFPESLTHLKLGGEFNDPLTYLPNGLTHIVFGFNFNHPIDQLPDSLTHIAFGYCFNQPVETWPHDVQYVMLGKGFEQAGELGLPDNATKIGPHEMQTRCAPLVIDQYHHSRFVRIF